MIYGYYINLDERGDFSADVRDVSGETIFEIQGGEIFEDGFMKHKNDLDGLHQYLVQLNLIAGDAELLTMREFEHRMEEEAEAGFEEDVAPARDQQSEKPFDVWSNRDGKLCVTEAESAMVKAHDAPPGFEFHQLRVLAPNRTETLRYYFRMQKLNCAERRNPGEESGLPVASMHDLVLNEDLIDLVRAIDADRLQGIEGHADRFFVVADPAPIGGNGALLGWYVDSDGAKQEPSYPNPILVAPTDLTQLRDDKLVALRAQNATTMLKGSLILNSGRNDPGRAVKARFDLNKLRVIPSEVPEDGWTGHRHFEFVATDGDDWKKARLPSAHIPINPHTAGPDYCQQAAIDLLNALPDVEIQQMELAPLFFDHFATPTKMAYYGTIVGVPELSKDWAAILVKESKNGLVTHLFAATEIDEVLSKTRMLPVMLDGKVLEARVREEAALKGPTPAAPNDTPAPSA